jgi:hypothetical protein
VRARLVQNADDWEYQGVLNHLPWYGPPQTQHSSARRESRPTSLKQT